MGNIAIFINSDMNTQYFMLCIAMSAISIWSTVPLITRLFTTMKRRSGLYFYSILITSVGISVRQVGVLTVWFSSHCPWVIRRILVEAGSMAMVSGFSLVLYSRLNLIAMNHRVRRAVLAMMIFNGFVWHVAVITTNAGIRYLKNRGRTDVLPAWEQVHVPMEKTKIVMFTSQEIIISLFYVGAAYRYLQGKFNTCKGKARRAMGLLLLIQVVIIALDIAICALNLVGERQLKVIVHGFVYAIKLELEFVVLNQLIELSRMGLPGIPSGRGLVVSDEPSDGEDGTAEVEVKEGKVSVCKRASDSVVDVESCRELGSSKNLEFITTPQDMEWN